MTMKSAERHDVVVIVWEANALLSMVRWFANHDRISIQKIMCRLLWHFQ